MIQASCDGVAAYPLRSRTRQPPLTPAAPSGTMTRCRWFSWPLSDPSLRRRGRAEDGRLSSTCRSREPDRALPRAGIWLTAGV